MEEGSGLLIFLRGTRQTRAGPCVKNWALTLECSFGILAADLAFQQATLGAARKISMDAEVARRRKECQ